MKIKCVTVDDEPLALEMINSFVKLTPFLELEKTFDNAIDALNYIQSNPVQLLFLDIQMADFTGMELARVISKSSIKDKPFIVFTTAYSDFALEGYRVDAIDYILKPFDYEDFINAVSKVRNRIETQQENELPQSSAHNEIQEYIFIKVETQIIKVETANILYIEGYKDYIKIHLKNANKPILSLMSLMKLEEKLNANTFFRIHRSFIVSLASVDALLKNSVRVGNKIIPVGTTYKNEYDRFVEKWVK